MDKRKIVDFSTDKLFSIFKGREAEINYLLKSGCKAGEKYSSKYITYRQRNKYSNQEKFIENFALIDEKCGIVLQGPIRKEDNFTIETVKLYKKYYPKALIIVSTWNDIDIQDEICLNKEGASVLKNIKPEKSGLGNINFQIISSKNGIEFAKKNGCEYILKTRTDQRICKRYFLQFFIDLLTQFYITQENVKQDMRIIVGPSMVNATMLKPFMISDFLYFGKANDLKKIFDRDLDETDMTVEERRNWINSIKGKYSISEFYRITAPETLLIYDFAKKVMMEECEFNIKSYWEFVRDNLICLGWNDIDLLWPKYGIYNESKLDNTIVDDAEASYSWDLSKWMLLKNNRISFKSEYEEYSKKIKS